MEKTEKKKFAVPSEAAYLLNIVLLAFSVALTAAADFGVSMIAAPSYILSLRFDFLSFGVAEYIIEGFLIALFCIIMKRVKFVYFSAFLTGLIYGGALDLWRLIPFLRADAVGTAPMALRIVYFTVGIILTAFSVAVTLKIYLYPAVPDFFVKGILATKNVPTRKMKTGFDLCFLGVALILSFSLFGELRGIGWGTAIITLLNGTMIALFERLLTRAATFKPLFPKLAEKFEI